SEHAARARALGAEIRENERVLSYETQGGGVRVKTSSGAYSAKKLVITGGAWSTELLKELGISLRIKRMIQYWFKASLEHSVSKGVPCFAFDLEDDFYYGFPMIDGQTVKLAAHRVGDWISSPAELDLPGGAPDAAKVAAIKRFIRNCLPQVQDELVRVLPCMY